MSFPGGSYGKESICNGGDLGLTPELGRSPGGGHGNPLQYSCQENPHGQRSLADSSPWGRKELITTERLSTHTTKVHLHLSVDIGSVYLCRVCKIVSRGVSCGCSVVSDSLRLHELLHTRFPCPLILSPGVRLSYLSG